MPFREKSAWLSIAAHVLVYGGYFLSLARIWDEPARSEVGVAMLGGAVTTLIAIWVALAIAQSALSSKDAEKPADERERLIDLKADRISSFALSIAIICLIFALIGGWNSFLVANLLLAALVVSELVKASAQIFYFRTSV